MKRLVTVPQGMLSNKVFLKLGEGTPVTTEERRAGNGMRAMLESPVHEAAVVWVNGKRAGSVWRPPYEIDVTSLLKTGENSIRIVVANLALNELAGKPAAGLQGSECSIRRAIPGAGHESGEADCPRA